jgi:putative DNA primase/helicase
MCLSLGEVMLPRQSEEIMEYLQRDRRNSTANHAVGSQPTKQPLLSGAVLRRISEIPSQKISWLWPSRIPLGKLSYFAGDPGLGKSFVTLDIAARVTLGSQWPDGAASIGQRGSVIILSAEDDAADTIRPRLEAAGADLSKALILQAVRRAKANGGDSLEQFNLATDLDALQDAVTSVGDVRLIILDPISAYLGNTDSHINAKVRGLLTPIAELARVLQVAIVAVDHLSKSNCQALYRPNGSIAFTAAARAVWFFAKNPDDPAQRLFLPGKLNLAPDQTGLSYTLKMVKPDVVVVSWGGPVTKSVNEVLQPEPAEQRSEHLEAMEWLRGRLSKGSVPSTQVRTEANAAGFSWSTVRRAKETLGIKPTKDGFQAGWSWILPAAEDAHETPKVPNSFIWASSAVVSAFGTNSTAAEVERHSLGNGQPTGSGYVPDAEGPGCSCVYCNGHFGTVAGWRAHISQGRCRTKEETKLEFEE